MFFHLRKSYETADKDTAINREQEHNFPDNKSLNSIHMITTQTVFFMTQIVFLGYIVIYGYHYKSCVRIPQQWWVMYLLLIIQLIWNFRAWIAIDCSFDVQCYVDRVSDDFTSLRMKLANTLFMGIYVLYVLLQYKSDYPVVHEKVTMTFYEIDENILRCGIFSQFYNLEIKFRLAFVSKKMCAISRTESLEYKEIPKNPKLFMKKIDPGYCESRLIWNNYSDNMRNLINSVPEVNKMLLIKQLKKCISDIHSVHVYFAKGCNIYMNAKNNRLFIK